MFFCSKPVIMRPHFLQAFSLRNVANILCSYLTALKRQKSVYETTEETVDRYLCQFFEFMKKYGIHVCCWSPPPSQNEKAPFNEEFPFYGTEVERNEVTLIFDEILKDRCEKYDFTFLSITKNLIDENYKTKLEFISDDFCHLSQKAWGVGADSLAYAELKKERFARIVFCNGI